MDKKIYNVNIEEFKKQFSKEYKFLYEHDNKVAGYEEAVTEFDNQIANNKSFKKFVSEYSNYIGDFISSDREAAALMFALDTMI